MQRAAPDSLLGHLQHLRRSGQLQQARDLLARSLAQRADARAAFLAWQHEPFWWQALLGPRVRLERRGSSDASLVRRLWADRAFMHGFNRMASPLPADDAALASTLDHEHWALPESARALHWTVLAREQRCGLVSLVDLSFSHRRAEFLIGVLPSAGPFAAAEAAHLVLQFAAAQARLERLSALFYADNTPALDLALRLGFEHEGVLRGHVRDPRTGTRSDLVACGLLLDEAFFARSARMRQRLLGQVRQPAQRPAPVAG